MSDFSYSRQRLRQATNLTEANYTDVDPRTHLRRLKRAIQDVESESGYKYTTGVPEGENPHVAPENVGTQTGRVEGRLVARTDWDQFTGDKREEESSPILAIGLGILGALITLVGLVLSGSVQGLVLAIGLLALAGAAAAYYVHEPDVYQTGYFYRKRIRVLMEGEVAEPDSGDPAHLVASDLTVTFAEDLEIQRRDGTGQEYLTQSELPERIRTKLDEYQDTITSEIDIDVPTPAGRQPQAA